MHALDQHYCSAARVIEGCGNSKTAEDGKARSCSVSRRGVVTDMRKLAYNPSNTWNNGFPPEKPTRAVL